MDSIQQTIEGLRQRLLSSDPRFSEKNGELAFAGVTLSALAREYGTPLYVYSQAEIERNINEIRQAFASHPKTKIFYASKACSVMAILRVVKDYGIGIEANSLIEVKKALEIGFPGEKIVFNGVVKTPEDLAYAIDHELYLINVDSEAELDVIDQLSREKQKEVRVCVRVEPNVPSATHAGLVTAYHAKAGIDLQDAERVIRRILDMPYVKVKGLHMHVGDQVPESEPFAKATRVLIDESRRLEEVLGCHFDLINVGGGIPVSYKYDDENGDPLKDNMYAGITAADFGKAVIDEVHRWREDLEICLEPGRKVVSSAAVMLTKLWLEKRKTHYTPEGEILRHVDWLFCDAGYNVMADAQHYAWFFNVWNASKISSVHDKYIKLAGPLCDGGDYYHMGVKEEEFLMPSNSEPGDILVFLDAGAYSIESQTVYNCRPRTPVVLIDRAGHHHLIRRGDTFADMLSVDIY